MGRKKSPILSRHAFSTLYERSHLVIFRYIFGLHGGPITEIEDLTGETFIHAWKARRTFQGNEDDAIYWLLRIARNLVYDTFRHQKTQKTGLQKIQNSINQTDKDVEAQIAHHEKVQVLYSLLSNLPPQKREFIVLRYVLGWRIKDIAHYFGMPENTASVTLRRIIEKLRQEWLEDKIEVE
ncbi:MAG: sigma-70 family RNA polymerase sigma factor [Chloroflexota bacterium]